MKATFRPLRWSEPSTPAENRRGPFTFKASWRDTLDKIDNELWYLTDSIDPALVIEADFREQDIRVDGWIRGNARQPDHPGVRIAFESKYGPLVYSTDSCQKWQHNVRSIALGLEALRAVDRYGVTRRGEQYTGWKAIGGAVPMPSKMPTRADAAFFMATHGGDTKDSPRVMADREYRNKVYRYAARRLHPDRGGSVALFQRLEEARRVLDS